jgi:hypothetical protein
MADIERIEVTWTGNVTGDGISVFYAQSGTTTAPAALKAFFTTLAGWMPTGMAWDIPSTGDVIDDATGTLTGVWAHAGGGSVSSSGGTQNRAQGVGMRVKWYTGGIVHGRRVQGSTFIVPLMTSAYESDGTITSAVTGNASTAANTLISATDTVIWSRPFAGSPTNPARAGSSHTVIAATIPDKVSWLRSRRT